jgi:hypothetical protein
LTNYDTIWVVVDYLYYVGSGDHIEISRKPEDSKYHKLPKPYSLEPPSLQLGCGLLQ